MEYVTPRQQDLSPAREVSIFILQNKKWVDVFSGHVTFLCERGEYTVVFRTNQMSHNHVYRLQNKIRRKGPKAFVVRAVHLSRGQSSQSHNQNDGGADCILAFRFENDTDAFNFQFFMEQKDNKNANNQYAEHGRVSSFAGSAQANNARGISQSARSPSILSIPTIQSLDARSSREHVNILPLTEENLLLHDARLPPRPRKVADILSLSFRKD